MKSIVAAALVLASLAGANAQTFPSRPVTLIVPFPPGGSTDTIARIMADKMKSTLGQSVIIENVGGAGGSIAVGRLARAAPDGYTIDIGQWDTHVGSILQHQFRSADRLRPDRTALHQSAIDAGAEESAGEQSQGVGGVDEGQAR